MSTNKKIPEEEREQHGSGKKCYVFAPVLVRLQQPSLKLPDYSGEEYVGGLEFD